MSHKITEEQLDKEVKRTIAACYDRNIYKRIDIVVNPVRMRVRFDVYGPDHSFDNIIIYSGQSLKKAMKIYNGIGNEN